MTVRVLTAMACPYVDAIGHPTGRKILRREPHRLDVDALIEAAGLYGIALEINSNYHRLDLSDVHAGKAKAQGVGVLIDSDAHSTTELGLLRWGVLTARRAWLEPADVWNTRDVDAFRTACAGIAARPAGRTASDVVTVDETLAKLRRSTSRRRRRRSRTPSTKPSICSRRCRATTSASARPSTWRAWPR